LADPSYFADLLPQIEVERLDPHRPPSIFRQSLTPPTTLHPASLKEAFHKIGQKKWAAADASRTIGAIDACRPARLRFFGLHWEQMRVARLVANGTNRIQHYIRLTAIAR
jgi:hypothetical protein